MPKIVFVQNVDMISVRIITTLRPQIELSIMLAFLCCTDSYRINPARSNRGNTGGRVHGYLTEPCSQCLICLQSEAGYVMNVCGHEVCCRTCKDAFTFKRGVTCSMCRTEGRLLKFSRFSKHVFIP